LDNRQKHVSYLDQTFILSRQTNRNWMSQFTTDVDGQFDVTGISGLNQVHRTSTLKKAWK